jgi:fructosamine-3-kinase
LVTLPRAVAAEIEAAIDTRILSATRVGGGCISPAARLETSDNQLYFVKWTEHGKGRVLAAEAFSLDRIAETNTVRVPTVRAYGLQWLIMEWLEPGTPGPQAWRNFGTAIERLHRIKDGCFGWPEANFIGALPQQNPWCDSWSEFWRGQRLEPQLSHAVDAGLLGRSDVRRFEQLFARLDELLAVGDAEGPSLLHGDLWHGNAHATKDVIVAIDPSAYFGHREVDLAMAELFGGFPPAFREAYEELWPLQRAGLQQRKAAYQLYYLLVHVNLFGPGYVSSTRNALAEALT